MRRISTPIGAGLLALALAAPCAGAATLVSPADGAVVTTKTTTLTWALAADETSTHATDASFADIFVPGAGINDRSSDRDVWQTLYPFLEPTATSIVTKPLFAGTHHWGVLSLVGGVTNTQSAVGTFTVKPKVQGKGLKIHVSRTGSTASLDWSYLNNLPRYSLTWTLYKNGQKMRDDTKRYRASERSIHTWLTGDDYVGGRRGTFEDGDRLKLTVKITSLTDGVKFSKTFTKSITVD
jgi:hypothetical protein